ncbi:hypothetical protein M406DRAFT_337575 [Cryphonectria parasitica EP155]|uniref:Helicase C-terminal domain-containing protein n=1 Tax=Cryphonectria parasitica (strain ATCC 38755 / EP155) TaxID=660469 RepID=A0A9P4YA83_CRYP1|nr:uncharacterized protein M406DRAFT_337575 [Cryphonectria parasitica EP155]KAF3769343.1 hypothetical protein M406DRAFT_337575 [Cryphonectria parasitica EP155]
MTMTNRPHEPYIPIGCLRYPLEQRDELSRQFEELSSDSDDVTYGVTRVYLLADDAENGRISRSNQALRRKKLDLLARLDFSPATWKGLSSHDETSLYPPFAPRAQAEAASVEGDMSLLKMFNTIPSPRPDVQSIQDDLARAVMSDLLASTVDGLLTEMYPYQCRSAALMHQREVEPGQTLDPRLVEVLDQHDTSFYYNAVTGDVLREPKYYEAVRGGILAEQMGAGKTLICLALIVATRNQPAAVPDLYQGNNITTRPRVGSLLDMAAAVATKHACPWKSYIDQRQTNCIRAIMRNPGWYYLPRPESRRVSREPKKNAEPFKIYLSHATLIIVPTNLLEQWVQEISKHTRGLDVCIMKTKSMPSIPSVEALRRCDILLFSVQCFQKVWEVSRRPELDGSWTFDCSLGLVHFKRCIVDEGHMFGNVKLGGSKTGLLQALDSLNISSRWIVTGTPSKGLFGMEEGTGSDTRLSASSAKQERRDIERIGSIATFYLKARPWSNAPHEHGDTPARWDAYMMPVKSASTSSVSRICLRSTFNSLIIRHQLSEVVHILPDVDARIVKLEGSYQDKLSVNLFSMMIIFNAVQSQRTDQDYFFHAQNRKSLLQLVHNLRQASFFGGSFFSVEEIKKALQTAKEFLDKEDVMVSEADRELLRAAIDFGTIAAENKIKHVANLFHEMPIYVRGFPGSNGSAWSMDGNGHADLVCTNWKLMITAQKLLRPFFDSSEELNTYLNSGLFVSRGNVEREQEMRQAQPAGKSKVDTTLAGNTKLGEDHIGPRKRHSVSVKTKIADDGIPTPSQTPEAIEIAAPLARTRLVSTTSAKLSYLVDAIIAHQKEEQMIVFYENDNVAWYLAGILEMLQVHHLIYAKGITAERRAQYVSTFNHSTKFRVLLMDISQAAFGLDMRSASRVYFISPVLNPQVEAQAIGRARRISQQKRVTVETLVLRDSLEEVIVERKGNMTQAEHRNLKTILDDRPIYEWILNAKIYPLPDVLVEDGPAQMAPLKTPQYIFGREFGREQSNPDEDILLEDPRGNEHYVDSYEGEVKIRSCAKGTPSVPQEQDELTCAESTAATWEEGSLCSG